MLLSACGTADMATPAPTSEAIEVLYSPTLQFWADNLAKCASNKPLLALYFIPIDSATDLKENDILFDFGQATQDSGKVNLYQVGWDQVVVIVNAGNQRTQFSKDELSLIFSGQLSKWEDGLGQPIQVWILPDGEPARRIFDNAILPSQTLSSEARLAPDPVAMLEAISKNTGAIGYLPESFLSSSASANTSKIKIIRLETSLMAELHQPVIAITQGEPKTLVRNILVCLQDAGK
jgi:hypothetical protein